MLARATSAEDPPSLPSTSHAIWSCEDVVEVAQSSSSTVATVGAVMRRRLWWGPGEERL